MDQSKAPIKPPSVMVILPMNSDHGSLLIFSRPPVPGYTKTRLIPQYGARGAAELARAFLLDTYQLGCSVKVARIIVNLAEPGPLPALQPAAQIWQQGSGDLGERMTRMARRALNLDPSFVIIVGSDSPGMPKAFIDEAVVSLQQGAPAVLGPAEDGGYYLLGLRRCPRKLLFDLEWSTRTTAARTCQRLAQHGLDPYLLPQWFDVDRPEDVERLRELLMQGELSAPHTKAALMSLE